MRSLGCAPIPRDRYLYKKRLGDRHVQRNDHMKTKREDGHLQAKERGLRRN